MKLKKMLSLVLCLALVVSLAACGNSRSPAGAASEDGGAAAENTEAGAGSGESKTDIKADTAAEATPISPEAVSVLWEDSHVYLGLSLGNYDTITTYAVEGYEDVPFIKVSDYMNIVYEGKAKTVMEDGVMKIALNGAEAVIDPEAAAINIDNPSRFRSSGVVDGAIVSKEEFNVVTFSKKNQSTQTDVKPLTVSLKDYHMPVIAYEDDVLMPFLALQNTIGAVTMKNLLAYNGKDYFNVFEASSFGLESKKSKVMSTPYMKAIYSGPFSKKEKTSQAYADYGYNATCLQLDLTYGHKAEKNITTFDEYFTRTDAKKSLTSTSPSQVMTAEFLLFNYLFDSGHDSVMGINTVFGTVEGIKESEADKVVEDIKNSKDGKELFSEDNTADKEEAEEAENTMDAIFGAFMEKGLKIPEVAPIMAWTFFFEKNKPKDYGTERLDYVDDTAVIYFDAFKNDFKRDPSFYLDPVKKEDEAVSNYAFFYDCFKDIKKHEEIKNVVINLSDNGGGDATGLISILGFLSKDGEVKMTNLDMVSDSYREEYYHVDTNLDGIADDKDGYGDKYDFFIMTSGASYSCGNALPYFAQQEGLAKIIGTQPGGGDCVVGSYVDAYGYCAAYSGMLKLGIQGDKGFVSNEKATKPDLDMMPTILDIGNVPWFDAKGITEAVHQCKDGKKKMTYKGADTEGISDALDELLKQFE